MITLPPPYHIIQTTLDMDMNARQRRAARRRAEREAEAYEQAMHAEQIKADESDGSRTVAVWKVASAVASILAAAALLLFIAAVAL